MLSRSKGQVAYALRDRSPLDTRMYPARLAFLRHAASVRPEPGSNSPSKNGYITLLKEKGGITNLKPELQYFRLHYLCFKETLT